MNGRGSIDPHSLNTLVPLTMRIPAIFFLTLVISSAFAQRFAPLQPPNSYRNADNPLYWKNRPPYPGYWQQDVHYLIKARLNDMDDVINGDLTLYYHNNSPDLSLIHN